MSFHGLQECRNVWLPDFHLKRGGHSVERLDALAFQVLPVLMQINEPWSNDQAFCRDHPLAFKGRSRDFLDPALADADIANRIKTCFRIDYTATLDHKIVALGQR